MVHLSKDAATGGGYDVDVTAWDSKTEPLTLELEDAPATGISQVQYFPSPGPSSSSKASPIPHR